MRLKSVLALFAGIHKIKKALAVGNSFSSPLAETTIHAGQIMEITWNEPVGETVDLVLMKGDPQNMETVSVITMGAQNDGELPWKVPTDVAAGKYSMKIVSNTGDTNFSPFFTIYDPVTLFKPDNVLAKQNRKKKSRLWGLF